MEHLKRRILVRTWGGHTVDILDPKPGDFQPKVIAHHLSLQNRYIGATEHGYSTAQHSVYVLQMVESIWRSANNGAHAPTVVRMQALLHDAEETYTGDIISPIKRDYRATPLKDLGSRLRGDILQAFGVPRTMFNPIDIAHNQVSAAEARDLMFINPQEWGLPEPAESIKIVPWAARFAEQRFLGELNRLMNILDQEKTLALMQEHG